MNLHQQPPSPAISRWLRVSLLAWLMLGWFGDNLVRAEVSETNHFSAVNLAIPDGMVGGAHDLRMVSSEIIFISSVQVRLSLSGNFNGDLYGYLRHESGLTVLLNRPGRTATVPNGYSDTGVEVRFTDSATGDVQ